MSHFAMDGKVDKGKWKSPETLQAPEAGSQPVSCAMGSWNAEMAAAESGKDGMEQVPTSEAPSAQVGDLREYTTAEALAAQVDRPSGKKSGKDGMEQVPTSEAPCAQVGNLI
jgi:hypothetical protein